jgi:hypothetical protein
MSQAATLTLSQEIEKVVRLKPSTDSYRKYGKAENTLVAGKSIRKAIASDLKSGLVEFEAIRKGNSETGPVDMGFGDFSREKWGVGTLSDVLNLMGVDVTRKTIDHLYSLPDLPDDSKAIVPILYLDFLRTGYNKPTIINDLIRDTVTVSTPQITMPTIKQADATLQRLNEGETIPMGSISWGGKTAKVEKFGRGFSMTDELVQFATIEILAPFLEDLGTRIGMSQSAMGVATLLDGVVTIGVEDIAKGFQYRDFLYAKRNFKGINRNVTSALASVMGCVDIEDMDEVKGLVGTNRLISVTTTPTTSNDLNINTHGLMSNDSVMFIDKSVALRRFVLNLLAIDSQKIMSKQITEIFATMSLGMTTIFEDGRFVMKKTLDRATHDFPQFMNATLLDQATMFKG